MLKIVLTGVKAIYDRPDFLALVLEYVTSDTGAANDYVDSVIAGHNEDMMVPDSDLGIIATELDVAGVKVRAASQCTSVKSAPLYNRADFITCIKAHYNANPTVAGAFADDVEGNTARIMNGPPLIIATELDAAGVNWHHVSM